MKEAAWKASENILEELGPTHVTNCVWSCEILDPLDRVDFCVDISETYLHKMAAMDKYNTQVGILGAIGDYLDGITKVRGYAVGCSRAESYKMIGNKPIKI